MPATQQETLVAAGLNTLADGTNISIMMRNGQSIGAVYMASGVRTHAASGSMYVRFQSSGSVLMLPLTEIVGWTFPGLA
jgi:hypothetical protein